MEMHGNASPFGDGELVAIVHKTLEVDGITMAHFFIFEAVIIMSMDPDEHGWVSFSWSVVNLYVWGWGRI